MSEPLNAAQIAAIESKLQSAINNALQQMATRKYAVDQALDYVKAAELGKDYPVMDLAQKIYDFITSPAAKIKLTINQ